MTRRFLAPVALAVAVVAVSFPARAAEFTEVIDAFDEGDPFDFSLSLGYSRMLYMANITRECYAGADDGRAAHCPDIVPGVDPDGFQTTVDVLRFVHERHVFNLEAFIGIYHDLQLKLALPIVISDARELNLARNVDEGAADTILADDTCDPTTGCSPVLFNVPFKSPNRSGIDKFGVGLEWAPFNQERDETKPTWSLFVEGWFSVGKIIEAKGKYKEGGTWTSADDGASKGISDGVHALRVGTKISRRFKYFDPYFGFEAYIPFPKKGESPWPFMDKYSGQINDRPPIEGTVTMGTEIIPWESVGKGQKFFIDLRILGMYHSEGREITPLFDALGTSHARGLNASDVWGPGSDFLDAYPNYHWTGLTDVENYATFGGRLTLGFITSKWFKISAALQFSHDTEHFLSFTDECNPANFDDTGMVDGTSNCEWDTASGTQEDEDSYNPDFRRAIDSLGNRFRIEESTIFTVLVNATAMF
jgi:hypothetical protein